MRIIKRNGAEMPYDCEKIRAAIFAANDEVSEKISDTVIGFIVGRVEQRCDALARPVHVEEVQDMVLDELDKAEAYKLARHYSEYRLIHEQQRRMNTTDGKILSLLERNNRRQADMVLSAAVLVSLAILSCFALAVILLLRICKSESTKSYPTGALYSFWSEKGCTAYE